MFYFLALLSIFIPFLSVTFMCGKKQTKKDDEDSVGKPTKSCEPDGEKNAADDQEKLINEAIAQGVLAKQDDNDTMKEFKSNWGTGQASLDKKIASTKKNVPPPLEVKETPTEIEKEKQKDKTDRKAIKQGNMAPQDDKNTNEAPKDIHVTLTAAAEQEQRTQKSEVPTVKATSSTVTK